MYMSRYVFASHAYACTRRFVISLDVIPDGTCASAYTYIYVLYRPGYKKDKHDTMSPSIGVPDVR